MPKYKERTEAIKLRKKGFSYMEILREIPVAKSTLSLWLRSVNLSKRQKQRLTTKKIKASLLGAQKKKEQRIKITKQIKKRASKEIKSISKKDLWLMGIMLYWAEGSKEKDNKPGSGVEFVNSDPLMIKLFLKWLMEIIKIKPSEIKYRISVHENNKRRTYKIRKYWAENTNFDISSFKTIYYKKNKTNTNRKNISNDYYGLLTIRIKKSSNLNRRIAGWIEGICKQSQS